MDAQDGPCRPPARQPAHTLSRLSHSPRAAAQNGSLSPGNPINVSHVIQTGAVINQIEDILGSVMDGILSGAKQLSIPFKSRATRRRPQVLPTPQPSDGDEESVPEDLEIRLAGTVSYPGRTQGEAQKFSGSCLA